MSAINNACLPINLCDAVLASTYFKKFSWPFTCLFIIDSPFSFFHYLLCRPNTYLALLFFLSTTSPLILVSLIPILFSFQIIQFLFIILLAIPNHSTSSKQLSLFFVSSLLPSFPFLQFSFFRFLSSPFFYPYDHHYSHYCAPPTLILPVNFPNKPVIKTKGKKYHSNRRTAGNSCQSHIKLQLHSKCRRYKQAS